MSFDEPLRDVAEGATKAVLNFSKEQIANWIERFKNRRLAFIEDPETIKAAKDQRKTSEFQLIKSCINDKSLRTLCILGLTFRRMEKRKQDTDNLRDKILDAHGSSGLHIAYFVQNGLFTKLYALMCTTIPSPTQVSVEMEKFLKEIDLHSEFIQKTGKPQRIADKLIRTIDANRPQVFVISASRESAMNLCKEVKEKVMEEIEEYSCEYHDTPHREIYWLTRKDEYEADN